MARITSTSPTPSNSSSDTVSDVIVAVAQDQASDRALLDTARLVGGSVPGVLRPCHRRRLGMDQLRGEAGASAALVGIAVLALWWYLHPAVSFRAVVHVWIRARYRRYRYRHGWAAVCALNGLAPPLGRDAP